MGSVEEQCVERALRLRDGSTRPTGACLDQPVFVMGCGHSGTTLMRELVGMHPSVYRTPNDVRLFTLADAERAGVIEAWNSACLAAGRRFWMDKMAAYIRQMGEILEWFPKARLVVMVRDGRDVALSLRKRSDFKSGVARWMADNLAAKPYLELPSVLTVTYERLVREPAETLTQVFGFLGEPFDPIVLDFWKANRERSDVDDETGRRLEAAADQRDFQTLRQWQISQPIYHGSGRWKAELTADERAYFKVHANDLLIEFGYATDDRW